MNVSTKKLACRLSAGKLIEGGWSKMRKDPIVTKELREQWHPHAGILLNKASIVQRKLTYLH